MTTIFVDKRNNKEPLIKSKQKYLRRNKAIIKKEIDKIIRGSKIRNITKSGQKMSSPRDPMSEPSYRYSNQGDTHNIFMTGNDKFEKGDILKTKKNNGSGSGNGDSSGDGTGEDDFLFQLTRDEFSQLLFDHLALPNIQAKGVKIDKLVRRRAGYIKVGTPAKLDLKKTFELAIARRIAARPAKAPFLDDLDLRYKNYTLKPVPFMQAVMFCIMDVSGSMEEEQKLLAKKFYILLDLFLTQKYQKVDLVFIRHHTEATACDEEEFFHSTITGGTKISSGLELAKEIILKQYPSSDWNIYIAQTGDGENSFAGDNNICVSMIENFFLPITQYFMYLQVARRRELEYYNDLVKLKIKHKNIDTKIVSNGEELFSAFVDFFSPGNK